MVRLTLVDIYKSTKKTERDCHIRNHTSLPLAPPGSVELDDWEVKDRQQRYLSDSGSSYFPAGFIQFQPSQGGVSEARNRTKL